MLAGHITRKRTMRGEEGARYLDASSHGNAASLQTCTRTSVDSRQSAANAVAGVSSSSN